MYDVVIVGAGLSGIGTAYWLQKKCPGKRFTILEARDTMGGTWDLFRYPGIRSDSDMFTFGYSFKPWENIQPLADGESIRNYLVETAIENRIDQKIQYGHKVIETNWSSEEACWTLKALETSSGETKKIKTQFLYMCSGYYSYEEAHRPGFEGEQDFHGDIVIPQFWPEDLDYAGKKVVIIGSGATAVTLMPTMAETAAHVTMLQRSPTYIMPLPNRVGLYKFLKKILPLKWAYNIIRWRNILLSIFSFWFARSSPERAKKFFMKTAAKELKPDFDVDKHLNPKYNPWDQRLCVVPDADLFRAINQEKASIVTDHIDRFTGKGILLTSGERLDADIIVLATGLKMRMLGGAVAKVDGKVIETNSVMVYKGMMISGIPNFAIAFGYTNASWTLKSDLTANYICRLMNYMDKKGYHVVFPQPDSEVEEEPFLDFNSGYVLRAQQILPKQGSRKPWRVYQNYIQDMLTIKYGKIADKVLKFESKA